MANNPSADKQRSGVRKLLYLFYALPFLLVVGVCGYLAYNSLVHKPPPVRKISAKPFATVKIGDLTAGLFTQGDTLQASGNDLFIEFRDAQGKLVDAGEVTFELDLHMPGMVMHSIGKVLPTSTPGQYRTTVEPQMAGGWTAKITISGPHHKAEASVPVKVM
ncbi:MAG TPA: FixH family protein [Candidatus Baltobacteraceae bacterium]|nr:FixH family protein [Candidatus Baltobacteraceae bacterium]